MEKYAIANNAIPLYAFYNYIDPSSKSVKNAWNCTLPFDHSKLGCTVTPLKNVKIALSKRGWRTFDKMHSFKNTLPLRCLSVCPNILIHDRKIAHIPKFDIEAKVYEDPWGWISEMGHLKSFSQMPNQFYDHKLGYYPKRILLINTDEYGYNQ